MVKTRVGIVHGFDQKCDRFLSCVFMQNRPEKCLMAFFDRKQDFFDSRNKDKSKSPNFGYFRQKEKKQLF